MYVCIYLYIYIEMGKKKETTLSSRQAWFVINSLFRGLL